MVGLQFKCKGVFQDLYLHHGCLADLPVAPYDDLHHALILFLKNIDLVFLQWRVVTNLRPKLGLNKCLECISRCHCSEIRKVYNTPVLLKLHQFFQTSSLWELPSLAGLNKCMERGNSQLPKPPRVAPDTHVPLCAKVPPWLIQFSQYLPFAQFYPFHIPISKSPIYIVVLNPELKTQCSR